MKWNQRIFGTSLLAGMLFLAGCYGGGEAEKDDSVKTGDGAESNDKKVLYLAAGGEIPSLKTNGPMDGLSQTILQNVIEGLFRLDQNDQVVPGVIDDYKVSDDGLTYTFMLNEKAKWSNGDPTTANDFVYAWKKSLHPDTIAPQAYLYGPIKGANEIQDPDSPSYGKVEELGVQALDDLTLEVQLENAVPYFTELLTNPVFYPQQEKFVEEQGDKYALEVDNLIYNGPFELTEWEHDSKWTLEKNEDYWDEKNVSLDKIEFRVTKDTATEVNLYETGDIDVANLSSEFIDVYEDSDEYNTSLKSEVYFLRMNQKKDELKNVNIRKAIDMAWDKEQASKSILKNGSIPAYFLVFPGFVELPDGADFRDANGDLNKGTVEEAQKLWQKGLNELGVQKLTFEMLSYDDEQRKSVAEFMKNQLEKNLPGLTIKINQQPNKQKLELEANQDYDLSYSGWRNDVADPVEFLTVFQSDGAYNWQDFKDDRYDEILKKAQTDFTDEMGRYKELQEAENILIGEEAAISPLYQAGSARLIKPYVKGLTAHGNSTFTYKWTTIEK
ncbi:peptide ABC transporter substrate-binding protein [Edaphobacillus lindanitolerans]|uniref:Oligopeptide transport system substrate-binding protein n=1 Tax=Edaphobacillus lindanitolerans TaxID=550447 RepID=A0A1U7PKS2_9BACI|nr:peptide ABC transporter substrate-binding protein [Edaphobacillus lindanitolerans]SIT71920.1 oligopeptide transport system substrate-binding protein [Edaphobacillus lindanitolerans]